MRRARKLVVLGGSSIASPELIARLAAREHPAFEMTLVGRDERKLERVGRVCAAMAETAPGVQVGWTTDLACALEGADFVLNQIRVGGLAARAFDESFPLQFDIPGEETVGPGGFANALRTVPVCLDYAREVERRAPHAWFINLTNPASIIQAALARANPTLRVVSVCDSPVTLSENVARLADASQDELDIEYVGMLHFGWITRVTRDGVDLTPRVLERIAELPGLAADPRLVQAIGAIPHPYLNYFLAPDVMLARQRAKGHTRAEELQDLEAQILAEYQAATSSKPALLNKRAAVWYEKIIVPVLLALAGQAGDFVVNVQNQDALPWLPAETIVELEARVTPEGITPYRAGALPRDALAMVQLNAAYEALVVDAILNDSYESAWRALRLHPLVKSTSQAREILDLVWRQ